MAVPLILASLAAQGFNLIANAVMAKGKDVIEEKLGVNLDESLKTEAGLVRLRELEITREGDLQAFALAQAEMDLQAEAMQLEDVQSARTRDVEFLRAGTRNYRADIMFVLALALVVWMVYIIWKDQAINEYVKGIFTLVLGRFLGYIDNVYNFEFSSTRSSKSKDASIENLTRRDVQ